MKRDLALGPSRIGDWRLFAPVLVFLLGIAVPPLALLGQLMLIPCVIVLLTMSVCIAEPGRIERCEWPPVILLAACNLVGTPLWMHALVLLFGLSESGDWLVLVAGCPVAGGAALVETLLRLPVRLLLTQLQGFFALPLTAPLIA